MGTQYCSNNCEKYIVLYGTSEKTPKMTFDYLFEKVCELIITMSFKCPLKYHRKVLKAD